MKGPFKSKKNCVVSNFWTVLYIYLSIHIYLFLNDIVASKLKWSKTENNVQEYDWTSFMMEHMLS